MQEVNKPPKVELLYWSGCPSWSRALEQLQTTVQELGLGQKVVTAREITTDEAAVRERFLGSPTIRINGRDIQPPEVSTPQVGLSCRVYRRRDGRISPLPDPSDIRNALLEQIDPP